MPQFFKFLLTAGALLVLTGCEGSPLGATLENNLEADPQLAASAPSEIPAQTPAQTPAEAAPEPGQAEFIGPVVGDRSAASNAAAPANESAPAEFTDLDAAPEDLQDYLRDLAALSLLSGSSDGAASEQPGEFRPNQPVTRREYARWLFAANNRFYADEQDQRIRAGTDSADLIFKDIPASDPDFEAIQGLAQAGIIPSPLTGTTASVNFRPDAPLTRSDLILWKVPLDTRTALPGASVESVKEAWGFQDAAQIPGPALQAVLADYQLGEFANLRRALGYTTLFQPERGATRAEAAAVLWRFGSVAEGITAAELLNNPSNSDET